MIWRLRQYANSPRWGSPTRPKGPSRSVKTTVGVRRKGAGGPSESNGAVASRSRSTTTSTRTETRPPPPPPRGSRAAAAAAGAAACGLRAVDQEQLDLDGWTWRGPRGTGVRARVYGMSGGREKAWKGGVYSGV